MKRELERIEVPDEHEARERSWAVVEAAFAEREPQPRRRSWKPVAALAVVVVVIAGLLSPPGRAVLDDLREAVGVEQAQPALFSLPAPGQMLVTADSGVWVVQRDGSKRLLGRYDEASWSPFGRFVVASRRNELVALTPEGEVRWSLARPNIRLPRWGGTKIDTRIAYFSGGKLRVVGGDGKGDRLLDGRAAVRAPLWSVDDPHALVYARSDGTVRIVNVDTRAVLDRDASAALLASPVTDEAIARLVGKSGRFDEPVASPDAQWLAIGWPDADQFLFARTDGKGRIRAVSNVARQFRSRGFPTISGWCCAGS